MKQKVNGCSRQYQREVRLAYSANYGEPFMESPLAHNKSHNAANWISIPIGKANVISYLHYQVAAGDIWLLEA